MVRIGLMDNDNTIKPCPVVCPYTSSEYFDPRTKLIQLGTSMTQVSNSEDILDDLDDQDALKVQVLQCEVQGSTNLQF